MTSAGDLTTRGTKSIGIVGQSIGGGGGNGGAAYALDVSLLVSAAVAVGGSGGAGGDGGGVGITLDGGNITTGQFTPPATATNLLPVDAIGILAQSIGKGGGNGGPATAGAIAVGLPVPPDGVNVTAATSLALGGSGGGGGNGGDVAVAFNPGTNLVTQGQGSHGILAQSVGGGGGNGGDSSASSATINYKIAAGKAQTTTLSFQVDVASGGTGGVASDGGSVNVTVGDDSGSTTPASIVTYGDFANGVTAHSIGGGGGNAGVGSGNTQSFGTKTRLTTAITLGSTGGAGGDGGQAVLVTQPNSSIVTYGDSSHGLVAQSIGGGGGTSQGGTLSLGASFSLNTPTGPIKPKLKGALNFTAGTRGGSGGNGGATVAVTHNGTIQTQGNDSVGILLQNIGGGGGVVGSAGAEASADNPLVPPLPGSVNVVRKFESAYVNGLTLTVPFSPEFTVNLGSNTGGDSGFADDAQLDLNGSVSTRGDWSQGVVVQAIGGGGGKAGSAAYTGSGAVADLTQTVGSSSAGGNDSGGQVIFTATNGTISTDGYSAFGVLLQSIGGGGGLAGDGSDAANGGSPSTPGLIAVGNDGNNGGSGDTVTIESGSLTVTTNGEAAHGIVLQSIGGGGGIGGAGNGVGDPSASNLATRVGTGGENSGSGGSVSILGTNLSVRTNADYAYGVLAQSIGGGGGLASVRAPTSARVGGLSFDNANGGPVNLNFGSDTFIQTQGDGAHGIVAQSISGGGGIGGYAPGGDTISTTKVTNGLDGFGFSATVTVDLTGDAQVSTNGAGAHGIVAQSIGGAGGIVPVAGGPTYFGSTNSEGTASAGGNVNVTVDGTVSTFGDNAVGVFAQSTSANDTGGAISVVVNGQIVAIGGGTNPPAIFMDGGNAQNVVNLGTFAFVEAQTVVQYTGSFSPAINNSGDLAGDIRTRNVAGGVGRLNNLASGTWFAGEGSDVDVLNAGTIEIGRQREAGRFDTSVIRGDFTQFRGGRTLVDVDFLNSRADLLTITGDANLAGEVVPVSSGPLTSEAVRFARVQGDVTGELRVVDDRFEDGSLFFDYGVTRRDRDFFLGAEADFSSPALGGLSPNQRAVAGYLDSLFVENRDRDVAEFFGVLDRSTRGNAGLARRFIDEFSPGATLGFGARGLSTALSFQTAALNGPVFEGDTARPAETSSSYFRTYGRSASQSVPGGFSDFTQNNTTYQVGGQWEVAPDWFVGGAVAYQYDWLNAQNGSASGDGHTGLAAITLKHERGSWLFSGAISGSAGWFETERSVNLPGYRADIEGHPTVQTVSGALRAAYSLEFDKFYVRPMLTLSTNYVRAGSYTESGGGLLDLEVEENDDFSFVASPGVELGLRTDFENGMILRSFVVGSVNVSTGGDWTQTSRFAEAAGGAGEFGTTIPVDTVSGRVTAGWQVQTSERTSVSVQYEGEYSGNVVSNGGAVGFKLQF